MGSTSFILYDSTGTNVDSQSDYLTNTARTNGATDGDSYPSIVFNKAIFQACMFVAALGQMLATKGYVTTDGDPGGGSPVAPATALATLAGVLAAIRTTADGFQLATVQTVSTSGTVPTGYSQLVEVAVVNGITRTLFTAFGNGNIQYTLKNSASTAVTLAAHSGENFDGTVTTLTIPAAVGVTSSVTVISTGVGWLVIG